jgi:hypothetical protein
MYFAKKTTYFDSNAEPHHFDRAGTIYYCGFLFVLKRALIFARVPVCSVNMDRVESWPFLAEYANLDVRARILKSVSFFRETSIANIVNFNEDFKTIF